MNIDTSSTTTTAVKPFTFHLIELSLLLLLSLLVLGLGLGYTAFPHTLASLHMGIAEMLLLIEVHIDVDRLRLVHELAHQLSAPELVHGAHKARIFLELHITGRERWRED